jgi:hypothetical protein
VIDGKAIELWQETNRLLARIAKALEAHAMLLGGRSPCPTGLPHDFRPCRRGSLTVLVCRACGAEQAV